MLNLFSHLRGKRRCRALFTTVLVCWDHDRFLVMWTLGNLKLSKPLHNMSIDVNRGMLGSPFPVVHDQLLCLANVEGDVFVLAPHWNLPIGCLIVVSDQAYHVMLSANLMMVLELWRGLSTHP